MSLWLVVLKRRSTPSSSVSHGGVTVNVVPLLEEVSMELGDKKTKKRKIGRIQFLRIMEELSSTSTAKNISKSDNVLIYSQVICCRVLSMADDHK